jgi:hypothetical protein
MDLFEVREGKAMPSVHALLIRPFKTIWEEDKTATKEEAIKAFTFIELGCSPKKSNPYSGYEEEQRHRELKKDIYGDETYRLPGLVVDGIMKYEEFLEHSSPSYPLLKDALAASVKFREQLGNIDLKERTNSGTAVYKPKDISGAFKDIPDMAKTLETLRERVNQELLAETKTRNNREIGYYEE